MPHQYHGAPILSNQNSWRPAALPAATTGNTTAATIATRLGVVSAPAPGTVASGVFAIELPPEQRLSIKPFLQHASLDPDGVNLVLQFFGVRESPKITASRADGVAQQYVRQYLGRVTATGGTCATPLVDAIPVIAGNSRWADISVKDEDFTRGASMDIRFKADADSRITLDYDGEGWIEVVVSTTSGYLAGFIWTTHN